MKGDIVNVELVNLYKCGVDIDLIRVVVMSEKFDKKTRYITPIVKNKDERII
jgi:hypothetical protein